MSAVSMFGFRPLGNQCKAFAIKPTQATEGELVRAYAAMARLARLDIA